MRVKIKKKSRFITIYSTIILVIVGLLLTSVFAASNDNVNSGFSFAKLFYDFLAFTGLASSTPTGNVYYVSTSGNDANSCATAQNIATPKRTINNAVGCLSAGSVTSYDQRAI